MTDWIWCALSVPIQNKNHRPVNPLPPETSAHPKSILSLCANETSLWLNRILWNLSCRKTRATDYVAGIPSGKRVAQCAKSAQAASKVLCMSWTLTRLRWSAVFWELTWTSTGLQITDIQNTEVPENLTMKRMRDQIQPWSSGESVKFCSFHSALPISMSCVSAWLCSEIESCIEICWWFGDRTFMM